MKLDSAIIIALISSGAAVFAALLSAFAALVNSRYSLQSPKRYSILEDQLQKVFGPLQHTMQQDLPCEEKKNKALQIMDDNFLLVPTELYQSRNRDAFPHLVEACFNIARKKLGYTQVTPAAKYSHISEMSRVEDIIAPSGRNPRINPRRALKARTCNFDDLLAKLDEIPK